MTRRFLIWLILPTLIFMLAGCSNNDDENPDFVPWEPSQSTLDAGPGNGAVFLRWNQTGLQRADSAGFHADGWCYPGQAASIEITCMVGLTVPPTATPQDSLHCDLDVVDHNYAQVEYSPDGAVFSDSVTYWIDTTVVEFPQGLTADSCQFYWYSRHDGEFHPIPTIYDPTSNSWKAKTVHFSRYIIGQKVRIAWQQ